MRSADEFEVVRRLAAAGVNDCAISRQIGVPRTTVRDWRRRPQIRTRLVSGGPCGVGHDFPLSRQRHTATCLAFSWATAAFHAPSGSGT
ncbi:helix-turn-helix domain-containing protein [Mycobacterium seoulense]|uniref:helix-turn-helix domain-containing protein n=1 Tax=Mycobacterium seoulense TaxID=386911 RepID=UPI003CEC7C36